MTELLYFSFSDLMVRVEYGKEANSLRYSSHRKLSFGERVIVEQYLLTNVALKTEYYKRHPALLVYLGIDGKLIKELNLFHLKNTLRSLVDKEKVVNESVKELIDSSLSSYYFERIGDLILDLRRAIHDGCEEEQLNSYQCKLEELIEAYNHHSQQRVTVEEVIPTELRPYLDKAGVRKYLPSQGTETPGPSFGG
jgi:hypothetical protein